MDDRQDFHQRLVRRLIEARSGRPCYVLYLDALRASVLTEAHPDPKTYDFEAEDLRLATGESAQQRDIFQRVLDTPLASTRNKSAPIHLMIFSDAAFLVYETALHAAACAASLMHGFITQEVPVRMGLAHGTWLAQQFSFDAVGPTTVTKSVFYGTGVPRATQAATQSGHGCRIFLHPSIDGEGLTAIAEHLAVLPIPFPAPHALNELNYLHPNAGSRHAVAQQDELFARARDVMLKGVALPVPPTVTLQYAETLAALNRMRRQLSLTEFPQ